ncbi:nonstructural protein 1 [Rodent bocavirus]|uniref:Initiator protein NS1 n=1 Tax=Rodent bocavirus TaxID=2137546 RepID=A0A2Z3D950_9VIRU|nr:nonstructural protein 1 [Rodent bocavirus]AVR53749.1 nonstructural protein 1 [Rodent bocavirus]AVR53768.1 nonstructural protein 1 [Rodent bocavirus]
MLSNRKSLNRSSCNILIGNLCGWSFVYKRTSHTCSAPFRPFLLEENDALNSGGEYNMPLINFQAAFEGFGGIAYTYILRLPKFPSNDYHNRLQKCFGNPKYANLHTEFLRSEVYDDFPEDCSDLNDFQQKTYEREIALFAEIAVRRVFEQQQMTKMPAFSSYVQVEHGSNLHVHLVLSGSGLTKYTAKSFRPKLATLFYAQLEQRQKENLKDEYGSEDWKPYTEPVSEALTQSNYGSSKFCTVLQYKSRNGEMYSCRVEARSFIANYLLPKNLEIGYINWSNIYRIPGDCADGFSPTTKTYTYTSLNSMRLPVNERIDLKQWLEKTYGLNSSEPIFTGDPLSDLPKVSKAQWDKTTQPGGRMSKRESLVLDCMNRAIESDCLTYEQLVDKHPELVIMMESQAGGNRLIEQTLTMVHIKLTQKYTAMSYIVRRFPTFEIQPNNKVIRLLNLQGYNCWQVGHWLCTILDKKGGKQNTMSFYGPASTGKTNLAKAIVNCVNLYGNVNHLNKNFVFNDCSNKLIIWWEEALMHNDWVEPAKCILGGTSVRVDRKHKDSQMLPQTPCILSTNNNIYECVGGNHVSHIHCKPLKDRVVQLNFMKTLPQNFGEISQEEVAGWLLTCKNRFNCTLEGFCNEWKIKNVSNDMPLAKVCPSHSQDFVLHEQGTCTNCGAYLPLDIDLEPYSSNNSGDDGRK